MDFGNIIYRTDIKAYIIKNGTYMIPHPDDTTVPESIHAEFDPLWNEINEYAKENPDKVKEEQLVIKEPTIEELKIEKLKEINTFYDIAISQLVSSYPVNELLTFDKQEQEANSYINDQNANTPFIDALALGREIDKNELISRILIKAESFATAAGYLTGIRQKYEDKLNQAQNIEEICSIIPVYNLPKQ